jgi:hypothetical protein
LDEKPDWTQNSLLVYRDEIPVNEHPHQVPVTPDVPLKWTPTVGPKTAENKLWLGV